MGRLFNCLKLKKMIINELKLILCFYLEDIVVFSKSNNLKTSPLVLKLRHLAFAGQGERILKHFHR